MASRSLPAAVRRGLTFWRRSIQARVVASTVVLSAVVVSIVGWILLTQTRDGLLDHRVSAVVAEANNETTEARSRLAAAPGTEIDAASQQRALVDPIIQRGGTRGFSVVLTGPVGGDGNRIADGALFTPGLRTASVPSSLEEQFDKSVASTAWTYTRIRTTSGTDGSVRTQPGIVVGSPVRLPADGETYVLYYLFPLDCESRQVVCRCTDISCGSRRDCMRRSLSALPLSPP